MRNAQRSILESMIMSFAADLPPNAGSADDATVVTIYCLVEA